MCIADTVDNGDGTFSAFCYCGWSTDGFTTADAAEHAASVHQTATDDAEARGPIADTGRPQT